jgi:antitoxin component YwqK of YwqJK toxin-antitoxin module
MAMPQPVHEKKQDKVPKGLKTKIINGYKIHINHDVEEKVLTEKDIYNFNIIGNLTDEHYISFNNDSIHSYKISYEYDSCTNLISRSLCYENDKLKAKEIYKYDNKDCLIEKIAYDDNDKLLGNTIFKYDDNKNQIELVTLEDSKLSYKNLRRYDAKGNIIEEIVYNPGLRSKTISKYDNKGNLIEQTQCDQHDFLTAKSSCKYDYNGNLIESILSDVRGVSKHTYKYNIKGYLKEMAISTISNKLVEKHIYRYDAMGNMIKHTEYEVINKIYKIQECPVSQTVYEYEFYPESELK